MTNRHRVIWSQGMFLQPHHFQQEARFVDHLVDARVRAALTEVVLLQADVTANNADDQALLKRFGLFGPPGTEAELLAWPQAAESSAAA